MPDIELDTAAALTGLARRTLWRRMALGQLSHHKVKRARGHARNLLDLEQVLAMAELHFSQEDKALIVKADSGYPDAQCELALRLIEFKRPDRALPWLRWAGERGCADAQLWLAQFSARGDHGFDQDDTQAMMWLTRAAQGGHLIALRQLSVLAGTSDGR